MTTTAVQPVPLPDSATAPRYDHVDPLIQWMTGGATAPAADATGVTHDTRYALDLMNSGTGALSLRVRAGTQSLLVNASGIAFSGAFSHTGAGSFSGSLVVGNGLTVTTGTTTLGGTVTLASSLQVLAGGTTLATLRANSAVTLVSTLGVSGVATFLTGVTMEATLLVTGAATFISTVTGSQFVSNVAHGSPPFLATSTTVCTNLNADLWDGLNPNDLIAKGTYTGDGTHNRPFTSLGYQPKYVCIISNGPSTTVTAHLLSTSSGTNIGFARVGSSATNMLIADESYLLSTGFQVDATGMNGVTNTSGANYVWAAWR